MLDPENAANTVASGPFKGFPNYATTLASENVSKVSMWLCVKTMAVYM